MPLPSLPKIPRSAAPRARSSRAGAAAADSWRSEADAQEEEEDREKALRKTLLSELLDIAVDPSLDTSDVGVAPVLWVALPENDNGEAVLAQFVEHATAECMKPFVAAADVTLAYRAKLLYDALPQAQSEAEKAEIRAEIAELGTWYQNGIEAGEHHFEGLMKDRAAVIASEAEALRDFQYALAVRKGGSGLAHVAAEEAALAQLASFAEGTLGEAYMRRALPLLQHNSSVSFAAKQRALNKMLYQVAR